MIYAMESIFLAKDAEEEAISIQRVCNFFGDLCPDEIKNELIHLRANHSKLPSIHEVIKFFRDLSPARKNLYKECILLLMPSSNAQSERIFSALRRMKMWLRTTISQNRLNHLMVMNVHKELLNSLDLNQILNDFIMSVPDSCSRFM